MHPNLKNITRLKQIRTVNPDLIRNSRREIPRRRRIRDGRCTGTRSRVEI